MEVLMYELYVNENKVFTSNNKNEIEAESKKYESENVKIEVKKYLRG